jgi:hypothetical protein
MFELCLLCPEDRVDLLSDALDALDALRVSVEDDDAQTPAEQALFGEPGMPPPKDGWQRSRMVALAALFSAPLARVSWAASASRACARASFCSNVAGPKSNKGSPARTYWLSTTWMNLAGAVTREDTRTIWALR